MKARSPHPGLCQQILQYFFNFLFHFQVLLLRGCRLVYILYLLLLTTSPTPGVWWKPDPPLPQAFVSKYYSILFYFRFQFQVLLLRGCRLVYIFFLLLHIASFAPGVRWKLQNIWWFLSGKPKVMLRWPYCPNIFGCHFLFHLNLVQKETMWSLILYIVWRLWYRSPFHFSPLASSYLVFS